MIDVYSLIKSHDAYIFANKNKLVATAFGQDPAYLVEVTLQNVGDDRFQMVQTTTELDDVEERVGTFHTKVLHEGSFIEMSKQFKRMKRKLCVSDSPRSDQELIGLALHMLSSDRDKAADDKRRAEITAANREIAYRELLQGTPAEEASSHHEIRRPEPAAESPSYEIEVARGSRACAIHERNVFKEAAISIMSGALVGAALVLLTFLAVG